MSTYRCRHIEANQYRKTCVTDKDRNKRSDFPLNIQYLR